MRAIFGFDSAWVDSPKSPGAISCLEYRADGTTHFRPPKPVSFEGALDEIQRTLKHAAYTLVAIDQPTIVPNMSGSRPVERVAGSLISWIGGGVQPANRSKEKMFGAEAPIWRFKSSLNANDDPYIARSETSGVHLIEVFPALALPTLGASYCQRLAAPKYNPANRKKFRMDDWQSVCRCLLETASDFELPTEAADCIKRLAELSAPRKRDQDQLDSLICLLMALFWRDRPEASIVIGDVTNGYIVTAATAEVRRRLELAAHDRSVPIDGTIPGR